MGCSSCVSPWKATKTPAAVEWTAVEVTEHQSAFDGYPGETTAVGRKQSYIFVPKISPTENPPPRPSVIVLEPPVSVFQPCAAGQTRESNRQESGGGTKDDSFSTPPPPAAKNAPPPEGKKLETKDFSPPDNSSPGKAVLRGGSRFEEDGCAASAGATGGGGVDRVVSPDGHLYGERNTADEMKPDPTTSCTETATAVAAAGCHDDDAEDDGGEMLLLASGARTSFFPAGAAVGAAAGDAAAAATDLNGPASSARIGTPSDTASLSSAETASPRSSEGEEAAIAAAPISALLGDGQPKMESKGLRREKAESSPTAAGLLLHGRGDIGDYAIDDDWNAWETDRLNFVDYSDDEEEEDGGEEKKDKTEKIDSGEGCEVRNEEEDRGEHVELEDEGLHVDGEERTSSKTGFCTTGLCLTGVLAVGIGIGIAVWARRRR